MSASRYEGEDDGDYVDRATDEAIQREVDDKTEAKRRASGISAEELSLQDAFIEGQRAGHLNLAASLNPWQAGTVHHAEWERGRSCVIGAFLSNLKRVA